MEHTMKATDFEYRHQTLLHLLVVGLAFLTYAFQRDDIVWVLVKHHTIYRTLLERIVFGIGAFEVLCAAALQTWAHTHLFCAADVEMPSPARDRICPRLEDLTYVGRLLFALGIGLLAPIPGTVILLLGEVSLVARLLVRNSDATSLQALGRDCIFPSLDGLPRAPRVSAKWRYALRKEASKWGLAITMIAFTLTLRDRVAEVLAGASFLLWLALNLSDFLRPTAPRQNAQIDRSA
jgi:hypothetical protein